MSYEDVKCEDCEWTGLYSPTNNGEIPDPCPECGGDLEVVNTDDQDEPQITVHKRHDADQNVVYIGICPDCGVEYRKSTPGDAEYAAKGCCP
jgi:Zn finger protein HypA/HybF involved in hydrogenase expression